MPARAPSKALTLPGRVEEGFEEERAPAGPRSAGGRGLLVAIYGPDGSGKSSVIEALIRRGGPDRFQKVHFRPGLDSVRRAAVENPHGQPTRTGPESIAKLLHYLVDFRLGYLLRVRPRLERGTTVIFDRYYHDLLVDPRRYRYGGPSVLARLVGSLIPGPDVTLVLDADPPVLLARKREVSPEELGRLRSEYRRLARSIRDARVVDASRPLLEVIGEVEAVLHDRLRPGERERYKAFPPGLRHIRVPVSCRSAALATLATYAPCRPLPRQIQRAAHMITDRLGPRALPGRARPWEPPMPREEWNALRDRWLAELEPFDSMGIVERPQAGRGGVMFLLLRGGTPVAFVKLRPRGGGELAREMRALRAVEAFGARAFLAPRPRTFGRVGAWEYLGTSAFPPELHRVPDAPPLDRVLRDVAGALVTIPRAADTPEHWRPMHGDFTPWNLRQLESGDLVLHDWEAAGWGPPGADHVLYRATLEALGSRRRGWRTTVDVVGTAPGSDPPLTREAVAYWRERVKLQEGSGGARDRRLARALRAALLTVEGRAG